MITVKLKYKASEESRNLIHEYMRQYSICLRFIFNRITDNPSLTQKKLTELSGTINGIDLLDSWFRQSSIYDAKSLRKQIDETGGGSVVFGGRKNFVKRCKGLISHEEWSEMRMSKMCSIGEALNKTNRKFRVNLSENVIIFQPDRKTRIRLEIPNAIRGEYARILRQAEYAQDHNLFPVTYRLDTDYVYITLDETNAFGRKVNNFVENRVFAIDMNPNYIGWTVVDWKDEDRYNIIDHGTISIKKINDLDVSLRKRHTASDDPIKLYVANKRDHEIFEISKRLVDTAFHYSCQLFVIEDLDMKSKDCGKGKRFNKLVNNNWCRDKLVNNLVKRCNIFSIKFIRVKPQYSSFIGNIVFRSENLPDMELASIEISRRGFEFYTQYVSKTRPTRKNIVQPNINNRYGTMVSKSLEEFGYRDGYSDLVDLYRKLKKLDVKYRLSLDQAGCGFSRLFSAKSMISWTISRKNKSV